MPTLTRSPSTIGGSRLDDESSCRTITSGARPRRLRSGVHQRRSRSASSTRRTKHASKRASFAKCYHTISAALVAQTIHHIHCQKIDPSYAFQVYSMQALLPCYPLKTAKCACLRVYDTNLDIADAGLIANVSDPRS